MTLGEYRVGISFNPSADDNVNQIKRAAADLIDLIAKVRADKTERLDLGDQASEISRLCALAMTHVEDGAMWAVKAATKGPMKP